MKEKNWIVIYRKIMFWEWYKDSKMTHLFLHLLLKANHSDGSWRGIPIKRGQLITGRLTLHSETGISEQSIRTCLTRLQKSGEILKESTKGFTIITICNYELYQFKLNSTNQQPNQQSTRVQPTNNQSLTTNNKNTNTIKEKPIEKEYNKELIDFCDEIILLFPERTRPKEVAQRKGWMDTIEKLQNEGYSLLGVKKIVKHFREHEFWSTHFLSVKYLLKTNKEGVRYLEVFKAIFQKEKPDSKIVKNKMDEIQKNPNRMRLP